MRRAESFLSYFLIFGIVISSFWTIYHFGINVPHWDDHAVRVFVDEFNFRKSLSIFKWHNEHRIVFTRLVALLINGIGESLNFKIMMFIGQIGLVGVLIWYIYLQRIFNLYLIGLIALACFVFNFSTYENSLWGMASVQNHWIIFWSISSFICVSKYGLSETPKTGWLVSAIIFSVFALLTSGNGVLVALIGFFNLLINRKITVAIMWAIMHASILLLYFWEFRSVATRPEIKSCVLHFITLAGSCFYPFFGFDMSFKIPILMGLINLSFAAYVLIQLKSDKPKLFIYLSLMAFFVGTILLVAISRNEYSSYVLLTSKYKIYSFLILSTSILFGVQKLNRAVLISVFAVILFLFVNAQLSFFGKASDLKTERIANTINIKSLLHAQKTSYRPPMFPFESHLSSSSALLDKDKVDNVVKKGHSVDFYEFNPRKNVDIYMYLKSPQHQTLIPLTGYREFFNKSVAIAQLNLFNFPSNIYHIFYLEVEKDKSRLYNSNKKIEIKGERFIEKPKNW